MAKSADQKRKILYLAEIFKEYTDEEKGDILHGKKAE